VLKSDFLDFPRYSGYSIQVKWEMYKLMMPSFLRI